MNLEGNYAIIDVALRDWYHLSVASVPQFSVNSNSLIGDSGITCNQGEEMTGSCSSTKARGN